MHIAKALQNALRQRRQLYDNKLSLAAIETRAISQLRSSEFWRLLPEGFER